MFFDFSSAFNTIQPHLPVNILSGMNAQCGRIRWTLYCIRNCSQYGKISHSHVCRMLFLVQELYDFSRNKLQHKVSQRFLVNRGVLYDILKV